MNRKAWDKIVYEACNGNESLFNKAVTTNFHDYFSEGISKITQDDRLAKDIYIASMTKFWERFILCGEPLPDCNIDGYIYTMAKNAFFESRRKAKTYKHGFITSADNIEILEKYNTVVLENNSVDFDDSDEHEDESTRVLRQAVQSLDDKCKKIVEQNILQNISLTKLKEELGINGSYNAIVQKKKRCLNHLKRILVKNLKKTTYKIAS